MEGDILTDAQIADITRAEAEDYLRRFRSAYRATPVLNLNTRRYPAGPGQEVEMAWVIDGAGGRDVLLYQRPTHFYRLGREVVLADLESYAAEVRERTAIRFAADAWVLVILPGGHAPRPHDRLATALTRVGPPARLAHGSGRVGGV